MSPASLYTEEQILAMKAMNNVHNWEFLKHLIIIVCQILLFIAYIYYVLQWKVWLRFSSSNKAKFYREYFK